MKKILSVILSAILMLNISVVNANAYPSADEEGANEPWFTFEELLAMSEEEIKAVSEDYAYSYLEATRLYEDILKNGPSVDYNGVECCRFEITYWDDSNDEEVALEKLGLPEEMIAQFTYETKTRIIDLELNTKQYGFGVLIAPIAYKEYTLKELCVALHFTLYYNPIVEVAYGEKQPGSVSSDILIGDCSMDGSFNISDAIIMLEIYACNAAGVTHSYVYPQNKYADIDLNNEVNIDDATEVLKRYAETAAGIK